VAVGAGAVGWARGWVDGGGWPMRVPSRRPQLAPRRPERDGEKAQRTQRQKLLLLRPSGPAHGDATWIGWVVKVTPAA